MQLSRCRCLTFPQATAPAFSVSRCEDFDKLTSDAQDLICKNFTKPVLKLQEKFHLFFLKN